MARLKQYKLRVDATVSNFREVSMNKKAARGFTLIEIAIVLVIIGLLLGGVLKGQELITSARVRNLISQQDGIKAAFFGFQDRYRALPGDYANAGVNIKCSGTCLNGDGNGQISNAGSASGAGTTTHEDLNVWTHLTAAGFLNGSYNLAAADTGPLDTNSPKNPYSVYLSLIYDNTWGIASNPNKHNLKSGSQIPVEIIAEVDRKIDDGQPNGGSFQFSPYVPGSGTAPSVTNCTLTSAGVAVTTAAANDVWNIKNGETNCGAASLF